MKLTIHTTCVCSITYDVRPSFVLMDIDGERVRLNNLLSDRF